MDSLFTVLFVLLLAPLAIYILARVISSAFFSAKFDHIKRIMSHADSPTEQQRPRDYPPEV